MAIGAAAVLWTSHLVLQCVMDVWIGNEKEKGWGTAKYFMTDTAMPLLPRKHHLISITHTELHLKWIRVHSTHYKSPKLKSNTFSGFNTVATGMLFYLSVNCTAVKDLL